MRLAMISVTLLGTATIVPAQSIDDQLRATTQALLDAVAPADRRVWDAQLDPYFTHLDENGVVRTRAEFLEQLTPLPAGLVGRIQIDTWRLTIHGEVAVAVYEVQERLEYHGQLLRSRFRTMDTWQQTQGRWRLISEHTAAVLKDPPAITLSQKQLCEYSGTYALTAELQTTIKCTAEGLESTRSGQRLVLYRAELLDVFFVQSQPRTRRIFLRDSRGEVEAFVDRREGEDIRWRKVQSPSPPIIDMHLHALEANAQGPPPMGMCTGRAEGFPAVDPGRPFADTFMESFKKPPCATPIWSPTTAQELMDRTFAVMNDLLAVMWTHPHVYVDVGIISYGLPPAGFHDYLRRIVEAGFGKRVMFGSDQMVWPETLEVAIQSIESATFLTSAQKRDIFYNNAARFLKLSDAEIARHMQR